MWSRMNWTAEDENMMGGKRSFIITLVAASLRVGQPVAEAANPAITAEPIKDSSCLDCHSDQTLKMTNAVRKTLSLFVDPARIAASVHKTNSCASCHADLTTKHPDDVVLAQPVSCGRCHERQSDSYGASVHGLAQKAGLPNAATCQDCHGSHEVLPPS